jgi:hypothetical protein
MFIDGFFFALGAFAAAITLSIAVALCILIADWFYS